MDFILTFAIQLNTCLCNHIVMKKRFDPRENYHRTREKIGYVPRKEASQKDYDRIGFMSGLEVHQQLKTREKLFCRCPAGGADDRS